MAVTSVLLLAVAALRPPVPPATYVFADGVITGKEIPGIGAMFRTIEPIQVRSTASCDDNNVRCES